MGTDEHTCSVGVEKADVEVDSWTSGEGRGDLGSPGRLIIDIYTTMYETIVIKAPAV